MGRLQARCGQLEAQLAEASNEAAAEQLLAEVDMLAAAKQAAEAGAMQLAERVKVGGCLAEGKGRSVQLIE